MDINNQNTWCPTSIKEPRSYQNLDAVNNIPSLPYFAVAVSPIECFELRHSYETIHKWKQILVQRTSMSTKGKIASSPPVFFKRNFPQFRSLFLGEEGLSIRVASHCPETSQWTINKMKGNDRVIIAEQSSETPSSKRGELEWKKTCGHLKDKAGAVLHGIFGILKCKWHCVKMKSSHSEFIRSEISVFILNVL